MFLVSVWLYLLTKSVESNQHHGDAAETVWLTYKGHKRECAHTSTVESCRGPRVPAESTVLMPNVSISAVGFQRSGLTVGILH